MGNGIQSINQLTAEQLPIAGGKGGSLAQLYQAGFPVPDGFAIPASAFAENELRPEAWSQVQAHLARMRTRNQSAAFALRSSAMSEDSAEASSAGGFETVLNVRTDEEVGLAIHRVNGSRQSERVKTYSRVKGMGPAQEVAVVVEEMVLAESSGVLFTANPVTDQCDQAMIGAAWGLGEAIVRGLVTPDTLIVDKATGRVLIRETADKQVMTVSLLSGMEEQSVPVTRRRTPVLSDGQAAQLMRLGTRIGTLYGRPMDIEWTLTEAGVYIVEARPITALPEPEPPVPTGWKLPKGSYVTMRDNIVELTAEPLTPLFGTLGLSAVNASMGRLLTGFFGRADLMPEGIILAVNDYAYYNGSRRPGQVARILLGSVGIMQRMLTGAVERWNEVGRPRYVTTMERWQAQPWRERPARSLLEAVRELSEAAIDAYGALVGGVIPAAWISEGLLTMVYRTLIERRDDPAAPTYLLGFNSAPIRAEKAFHDLAKWDRAHSGLATHLENTPARQLATQLDNDQVSPGVVAGDWCEWQSRFQAHLQAYGHTIYSLDFANPVAADAPTPLLETCRLCISGQGAKPHTRQQAAAEPREQATQAMLQRLKGLRLRLFRRTIARAQRYAPLREDGQADVGRSHHSLRQMLRELGRRFAEGRMIETADDIFWLKQDEVEQAAARLDRGEVLNALSATNPQRKATRRAAKRHTPPVMLPQTRLLGMDLEAVKTARARRRNGDTLKGVVVSPGSVTAAARVPHRPEDFDQMQTDDVLVAAITTPAWTPLFARAAAVVTDVGGPLSHGSIVAREYGVPAVLGTGSATKRIRSGQVITVDGSDGVVSLVD